MYNCEPYYDSDEGVGIGPITLREEKALLRQKQHRDPTKSRRESASGRLQNIYPNQSYSTEYFTAADTSAQTNMAADSSSEDVANKSIKEAVGNIIKTLDCDESANEVIEISDDSVATELSNEDCVADCYDESEIINVSSTSSSSEEEPTSPCKSIPKFKIDSPTSNLRQPLVVSANNSPIVGVSETMSDSRLLQEISALHLLSPKDSVHTDDESFLLQSTSHHYSAFADDEREEREENNDSLSYETAKDVINSHNNSETIDTDIKKCVEIDDNAMTEAEICGSNNTEINDVDILNSTMDRIESILNSGSQIECKEFTRPYQGTPMSKMSKSTPNTPNTQICTTPNRVTPFKVPTKIPRSLKKEMPNRSRFDNIKSPVAHYIKNSPYAPIIQNQPCPDVHISQLHSLMDMPPTKPKIHWPKVTLPEKFYNRGEVQIVPEHKPKVLKLPANIEAITINMGVIKRHLGHQGSSRLPVPQIFVSAIDADLHATFMAQNAPRADVSIITEQKVIID